MPLIDGVGWSETSKNTIGCDDRVLNSLRSAPAKVTSGANPLSNEYRKSTCRAEGCAALEEASASVSKTAPAASRNMTSRNLRLTAGRGNLSQLTGAPGGLPERHVAGLRAIVVGPDLGLPQRQIAQTRSCPTQDGA